MKTPITHRASRALRPRVRMATAGLLALLAGFAFTSCDVHKITGPGSIASITVTPDVTLPINATQQFVAVARDAEGVEVPFTPTWSVVEGGGTIDSDGMFTAGTTPGVYAGTVQAASGGMSGTASVTVTVGPAANIIVSPNPETLDIADTQQFTAVAHDAGGNVVAITPVWSVVAGGGTIDASGMFTAGDEPGTYVNTVQAADGGLTGSATVTVLPPPLATITVTPDPATMQTGGTQQFTAVGRDANGDVVAITPAWSVVNDGGTIDASSGMFTAGGTAGTFDNTVRATSGGIEGFATVTVTAPAPPLTNIIVTPNPASVQTGGTQQFTAVGRDASGNVVSITPVWSIVNGGGAINGGSGMFTAGGTAGTYANTVRATSGGIEGFATVVVTSDAPAPLATITVAPDPGTVQTGGTQQFTAVGRDADGNVVTITPAWSVVNGGGAIHGSSGLFTAGGTTGTFDNTVRATSGGIEGFATVIVTADAPAPLASITVSPDPATMATGDVQQFTAVGRDADGNVVAITPTWSVVNDGGTIDGSTGLFTAGGEGGTFNNTVRAASGGIEGFATVIVEADAPPGPFLDLGSAATYGILAGSEVSCVTGGTVNADIGIFPGEALTGFGPCTYSGTANLGNAIAEEAQNDLTTAYNTLAGLACDNTIVADLGGTTLLPGVYCHGSGIGVTGTVTLDGNGDPDAVFVFQAGSTLTTAGNVALINGASAENVYWQVGSSATFGTASQWQGNVLTLTSITLNDNANLLGRALARNGAVTLGTNNTITLP